MTDTLSFSTAVRERSRSAHSASEHAGFMDDLMRGEGTREDYAALVAQHWFIYEALEGAIDQVAESPVAAPFLSPELTRVPALEADLACLIGPQWRSSIRPLPTTVRYVERIREVAATWPGGYVAHHYTRYLGDLSGGQFIGKLMARQFGFDQDGIRFYLFEEIADPAAFKDDYRARLDAAGWDAAERDRVIDEVLVAYQFNTDLFVDLADAKAKTP